MSTFLRKFRIYLINKNISASQTRQYILAASIFLCRYHKDISKITNKDLDSFLRLLIRKQYKDKEIQLYEYVLNRLFYLIHNKIFIEQEKKLHHKDEVLFSRCTKSNKKRQSMAGMVN